MIHVVVPVYNEADNVDALLEGLHERLAPLGVPYRVVFIDDGSTDGTASRIRARAAAGVEVLVHPRNLGPGAAFRTGFLHVLETADPLDLLLTIEGDGTSDPRVLMRMLHRAWEEGDQIVLASCYLYGGGIRETAWHRVFLSHVANGLMKKTLGLSGLATLSSFYRLYQVSALSALRRAYGERFVSSTGFECMVEILYRAAQLRLRISEVPMMLDGSRRMGRSKMRVLLTAWAYLRLAWRARMGRL